MVSSNTILYMNIFARTRKFLSLLTLAFFLFYFYSHIFLLNLLPHQDILTITTVGKCRKFILIILLIYNVNIRCI